MHVSTQPSCGMGTAVCHVGMMGKQTADDQDMGGVEFNSLLSLYNVSPLPEEQPYDFVSVVKIKIFTWLTGALSTYLIGLQF